MSGDTGHIDRDELIDLALDALAESRIEPVLDHLAWCDACATRSSAIARAATLFDDWRERLAVVDAPDVAWHARLLEGVARLPEALRKQGPIAALISRTGRSPAANVDAALTVIVDSTTSRAEVALAALRSLVAPPLTLREVSPGGTRGADAAPAVASTSVVITGTSFPGARIVVQPDAREIVVEFAPEMKPAAALLLPADPALAPALGVLEALPSRVTRARFTDVRDGEHLLVVYLDR